MHCFPGTTISLLNNPTSIRAHIKILRKALAGVRAWYDRGTESEKKELKGQVKIFNDKIEQLEKALPLAKARRAREQAELEAAIKEQEKEERAERELRKKELAAKRQNGKKRKKALKEEAAGFDREGDVAQPRLF